ncbi:MAG: Uma2 family endonuclease [Blastocatellia bacterium]|nr:Uma2 family endonuclease [Blastocatellia bacterium]
MAQEIKTEPDSSTTPSPPAKMTYEEFLDWIDDKTHAEWVDGEVVFMSPISKEHQDIGRFLLTAITLFVEVRQSGTIFYDPFQMKTGPDLPGRAPDILFLAKENLSRLKRTHLDGPADLVIEIISPESRTRDREEKFYEYQQGGVREYWLIDPLRKQAEFYHLGEDGIYRLAPLDEDNTYHSRVLEGLWLKVEWLWQEPLPPLLNVLKEWGLV